MKFFTAEILKQLDARELEMESLPDSQIALEGINEVRKRLTGEPVDRRCDERVA